MSRPMIERENALRLGATVDSCFSEGHFSTGIHHLDSLRSPHSKPSPLHMSELVYIALHPPPPIVVSRPLMASPQKLQDRQKAQVIPPVKATQEALDLLQAYCRTNDPASLMQGLPCHPLTQEKPKPLNEDDYDSDFKRQASIAFNAKDCWAWLAAGFITKADGSEYSDDEDFESNGDPQSRAVGKYAWGVFEWLLNMWEKDEALNEASTGDKYSPLLLQQVPAPRTGTGLRWDVTVPLNVLFSCYSEGVNTNEIAKQIDFENRSMLSSRLLSLLVNLASASMILDTQLLQLACVHLTKLSPARLFTFLSLISHQHLNFKIALCSYYITSFMGKPSQTASAAARPNPRARPTAASRRAQDIPSESQPAPSTTGPKTMPFALPSPSDFIKLLDIPPPREPEPYLRSQHFRYHLISAYVMLYKRKRRSNHPSMDILDYAQLRTRIDDLFGPQNSDRQDREELGALHSTLLTMIA
ncbi:hypothetical protein SISSUDRAFT_1057628 [Sistotremastrum suecicum HHB10207 ss-3]|uniref:Uncharacterized protein n=1 Tax=Sistotremastrum suecicum HHB10207 ss-3 TaxID=1314776 RepID=A0A166ID40_9AGAM|nr:hypothetical protein SISSUDRAFT_1057628 [Sistotremastrum suecicum HHB10207 ss-3]